MDNLSVSALANMITNQWLLRMFEKGFHKATFFTKLLCECAKASYPNFRVCR